MTREPPTKTIKRKTQITNKCQFSCCSLTCMQYESQVIDWCYKHRRTKTLFPLQTDWIIVWSIFFGSSCNRISDSKFLFYIFILILKRQIFLFLFFPISCHLLFNIVFSSSWDFFVHVFFPNVVIKWKSNVMNTKYKQIKVNQTTEMPECTNHSIWQEHNNDANTDEKCSIRILIEICVSVCKINSTTSEIK